MGSGMATIRDPNPVKLGEFHTVELHRNHTLGYIVVDGGQPINGSSQVRRTAGVNPVTSAPQTHICCPQGKFQGLDLNEELHVGGYPNYTLLAKTAGIKAGFVGETPAVQQQPTDLIVENLIWFCCSSGCIRQLVIQGEEVIFKDLHRNSTGVTDCPTCKDGPCQVSSLHRESC